MAPRAGDRPLEHGADAGLTRAALERARARLSGDARARSDDGAVRAGYLDLLDREGVGSTVRAQALMLSRVVPAIYERPWRPALGRIAKGPWGPSMEGELRGRSARRRAVGRAARGLGDLACGTGNFTRELGRAVGRAGLAVGVDVSETMLARAAERARGAGLPNVAYVRAAAEALPLDDGVFDAVCCFAARHLFADPFAALGCVHDVPERAPRDPHLGAPRSRTGASARVSARGADGCNCSVATSWSTRCGDAASK